MIRIILGILLVIKASIYAVMVFIFLSSNPTMPVYDYSKYDSNRHIYGVEVGQTPNTIAKSISNRKAGICSVGALLFGIPGIILIKSGKKALNFKKAVLNSSFKMIRETGHIDVVTLGKEVLNSIGLPFQFYCPHCRTKLECSIKEVGGEDTCYSCRKPIHIPSPSVDEIKVRMIILKAQHKGLLSNNIEIR